MKKAVLCLGICHRVESANPHDLANGVATTIIGIRVCAQNTAKVRFKPQLIRSFALLASVVYAKAVDSTWYCDMDSHVESGEGIVAAGSQSMKQAIIMQSWCIPVKTLHDLDWRCLAMILIREGIDISCKTGG
jgi:hypothetical protein